MEGGTGGGEEEEEAAGEEEEGLTGGGGAGGWTPQARGSPLSVGWARGGAEGGGVLVVGMRAVLAAAERNERKQTLYAKMSSG